MPGKRKQLPIPDETTRRDKPIPPPPGDSASGPPLPNRPTRPVPPPPKQESVGDQETYDDFESGETYEAQESPADIYDDGDVGDVYDEAEIGGSAPPLPPPPPSRKLPQPPPGPPQDTYEIEPEVDDPSMPEETYEVTEDQQETYDEFDVATIEDFEEPQETYDEFEVGETPQDIYEPVEEGGNVPPPPPSRPAMSTPAAPPVPTQKKTPPHPQKNVPPKPKPAPVKSSGGGLDLSSISSGLKMLKKVDKTAVTKQPSVEEKTYSEGNLEFKSVFQKFKQKDEESSKSSLSPKSPGLLPLPTAKSPLFTKPAIPSKKPDLPLPGKPDLKSNPSPSSIGRPPPPIPADEPPSPDSPPPPPPPKIDSVPQRPPVHGYSKVNLPPAPSENDMTNGGGTTIIEDDDDGEIYDDAISDPLIGKPYYFKDISRQEGENKLRSIGKDGAYLIRESSKGGSSQPYTLMVMYKNKMYNLKIRERSDGKFALGEDKADEMAFMDVMAMVNYHRDNEVILVHKTGQYRTCLIQHPRK